MAWYLFTTSALALTGMLAFLYFWRKGQFDDVEDVKYQVFRDGSEDLDRKDRKE